MKRKILIDADFLTFKGKKDTPLDEIKENIQKVITYYQSYCNCSDVLLFLTTCKNNFRKTINTTYKAHRLDSDIRQRSVILKEWLKSNYNCIYDDDLYEADDLICDYYRENPECILMSQDKDVIYTVSGSNNILITKKDGLKHLTITDEQAEYFLHLQILIGDVVDNIESIINGAKQKTIDKILKIYDIDIVTFTKFWCHSFSDYETRYRMLYQGVDIGSIDSNFSVSKELLAFRDDYISNNYKVVLKANKIHKVKNTTKKIKKRLNKKIEYKFTFGKYKDYTIEEVVNEDKSYIKWILSPNFNNIFVSIKVYTYLKENNLYSDFTKMYEENRKN